MSGKQISLFKSLPEQELQTYITQLQTIKAASNGIFNETAILKYSYAIQGLEAKQAALLLSTQGLTNAQIAETLAVNESNVATNYQVMADAGLLASKQKLTIAQIQENLQTVLGAEADTSAAMKALGLSAATEAQMHQTVKLSAAKIQEAVDTNVLTEAQSQELAMRTGVILSMNAQTASTLPKWIAMIQAGTKAIWSQVKATAVWLATTPAGWATTAIAAIGGVIVGLNKLAKAEKDASDKAQEAYEKSKEKVQSNKEETKSLDELIRKYEELKSSSNISSDNRSEIKELQYDIVDLVGAEAKNLDLVNGKLDEELRKLKEISAEKSRQNVEEARNNYNKAVYTSDVMVGDSDDYGNDVNVKWLGTESKQIHKADGFEQINYDDFVDFVIESGFGDIFRKNYDENIFNMRFVVDTKDIDGLESKVKRLEEFKDFLAESGLKNTELYQGVSDAIERYQSQTNYELEAVNTLTDALIDDLSINNKKLSEITVDSMEDFEQYRQTMISEIKSDEDIGEALADGLLSEEAIERAVNDFMATANEFSDWYVKWQESITGSALNHEGEVSLSTALTTSTDSLDKFQSSVKSAADAYTTLLTGNYSSSELLDSIQAITKAASDMGESIDWESISTSGNPLQAIQDAIESVSKAYADSVLSGAGIDSDSKFGQMLANIVQEAYESKAALSSLNTQIDSLQSAYSSLTDIIQTYNETGYITFDQLQTLLAMEPQYIACLIDENGQLQLNQESMMALANQRLNDAESQAIQQAMTELGKVAFQEEQTAVEDNAQAFSDAVDDLSTYNEGLAETIATANVATSEILKLNDAINGAESEGATDDQIDSVLDNLNTKLKLIQNTRNNLKDNFNNFGKIVSKSSSDSSSNNSSSASSSTESTKEFSDELNWVEKLVNKVSTALDKLKDKVFNTYIGWSVRNHSLSKAMEKTNDAINVQQQAYEKYMQKAASVGLSQEYINKIQNGSLNIEDIANESLSDKIKEYETWYDKATECSDAIEELRTQLSELSRQKFDNINTYFNGLMETTEKAISRLETKAKNTFKAPSVRVYNGLYDETQNLINYNTQKVQQLEETLDSAVNSGYIEAGSEAWRDMYNEILDVRNATEEYKLELQDIAKRQYEAIIKPIEQELAEQKQEMNIIEKMQDRLALQGYVAAKGLYERQIRDSESRLNTLKEQATLLQQNMDDALSKGMEVGSDDWIDMKSAIDDNVISVMELENSIIELNNALRDLEWGKFDRFQRSISRITGESDFMISMYSKDDTHDEDGKLTDAGSAVIGLHAQNYFAYKEQARAYKDEVDKINKELEADPTNTTLIDRKNDLIDAYQNATKAAYDEYEAVIELGKDGYQAQIDSIQELIDAKKKQLEADKSLYEYQKKIAEKTKNITDIQKQLSALANDDSEENKAKIQKLKVDLTDAQKDLEDAQYDKWYNDQQDMLDRLAEEYAALISEQSQNEQEVFQEMIEYVNANAQDIQDTISSTAQEWGYIFNHGIDSVLDSGISGMTDIGQNIYEEIQRLYELNERMYRVSADLGDLGVTDYGLETTISDETTARNFIERLYNGLLDRHSDEDGLNFWMNKLMNGATVQEMLDGFLNSDEYKAMGKSPEDTILDFYEGLLGRTADSEGFNHWKEQYRNGMSLSEIGTHGFLDSDEFLSRDFWTGLLDAKPIARNEMLIPIADYIKGIPEEQLTAFQKLMTADLNLLANNTISPQSLGMPDYSKMQNVVNTNMSTGDTNINNTITIPIDHVNDYNDFVTQMQKDGKFEKMIEDMTIGKLAGKNSLSKNNYKWK